MNLPVVYTLVPAYHYPYISTLATKQPAPSYVLFNNGHESKSQGWRQPPPIPSQQPVNTEYQIVQLLDEYKRKRSSNILRLSSDGTIDGFETQLGQLHELLKARSATRNARSPHERGWNIQVATAQAMEIIRLLDLYNIGQITQYRHHLNNLAMLLAIRSPYVPNNMAPPPPAAGPRNYGAVDWNTTNEGASSWYTTQP